jgi:hypothetical protein
MSNKLKAALITILVTVITAASCIFPAFGVLVQAGLFILISIFTIYIIAYVLLQLFSGEL